MAVPVADSCQRHAQGDQSFPPQSYPIPECRNTQTFASQTESPSRQGTRRRKIAFFDSAFLCEYEIPFGIPALARQRQPRQPRTAFASHFLCLSAKRNGGGTSVISGVDDNAITVSVVITDGAVVRQRRNCRTCISRYPATAHTHKTLPDKASPFRLATPPYRKRLPWPITMHCHGHIIVFLLRFASRRDRKTVPGCGLVPEARYPNNPIQAQRSGAPCETLT